MKTICFINNKGGVGKTASVTTIAHMMATLYKKRVLIVDLDPQGNSSALYSETDFIEIFLGILNGTKQNKDVSIEDVLLYPDMDIHESIVNTKYEGLDIIPAHLTLSEVEERIKADVRTPQQFKLKAQLAKIKDEYDYCLIDCSPSISLLNINGLVASDEVYVPLRCDGASCIGLAISMNLVKTVQTYNPAIEIAGCFLTQFDSRKNVAKSILELLQTVLPNGMVLPIQIGNTKYLEENTFQQKPLLEVDSGKNKCSATLAYMKLVEYMIAPNKTVFLKNYAKELEEIKKLRMEEEKNREKEGK